jgi:glucose-1-phosphate cytidylyltransferase
MKVVILAGGRGLRFGEQTKLRPKPMIEIGGLPIIWHIMKYYSVFGFSDFIICCGYKGEVVKEFFTNYFLTHSDITLDFQDGAFQIHKSDVDWRVTLIDTGLNTSTGGRLKAVEDYIGKAAFMLTYGDGLSNVDLNALISSHRISQNLVTVTSVRLPARYGIISFIDNIIEFCEKPKTDAWINAGFMVCEPEVFGFISQNSILEKDLLEYLSKQGQLGAYKHEGFWQCMDNIQDKAALEALWETDPPWRIW